MGACLVSLLRVVNRLSLVGELTAEIASVISKQWDVRQGREVPSDEDVSLSGGAVKLEGTVLYADLFGSSRLATDLTQRVAGKVYRSFLGCTARLITERGGKVTAYDGDRVMGIFLGESKNSSAAKCALQINHMVTNVIRPKLADHFASLNDVGFQIAHCVGVDTSSFLAVKAGRKNANDLVWIGRAPNLAARLSEIRQDPYRSFISGDVFSAMNDESKYGGDPRKLMWNEFTYQFAAESIAIYGSSWTWTP
jgi:class 3 adenylate cyclase